MDTESTIPQRSVSFRHDRVLAFGPASSRDAGLGPASFWYRSKSSRG